MSERETYTRLVLETGKIREYITNSRFKINEYAAMIPHDDPVLEGKEDFIPDGMRFVYGFGWGRGFTDISEVAAMRAAEAMTVRVLRVVEMLKAKCLWRLRTRMPVSIEEWMSLSYAGGIRKKPHDLDAPTGAVMVVNPIRASKIAESAAFLSWIKNTCREYEIVDPANPNRQYGLNSHPFNIKTVVENMRTKPAPMESILTETFAWPTDLCCILHMPQPGEKKTAATVRLVMTENMIVETYNADRKGRVVDEYAVLPLNTR